MNKQQIATFVKEQRLALSMTQQQLADAAQVRRQTVNEIENAVREYGIDKLLQVLEALETEIIMIPQVVFRFRKKKKK